MYLANKQGKITGGSQPAQLPSMASYPSHCCGSRPWRRKGEVAPTHRRRFNHHRSFTKGLCGQSSSRGPWIIIQPIKEMLQSVKSKGCCLRLSPGDISGPEVLLRPLFVYVILGKSVHWRFTPISSSLEDDHSAPGDSEGQGGACCSPWGCRVRHNLVTEQQPFCTSPEDGTSVLGPSSAQW